MSGALFRSFFSNALTFYKSGASDLKSIHTSSIAYAARKGTRAKARAKKVKVEVTKVGFIPHNQRGKNKGPKTLVNKHFDDSYKQVSSDNVYPMRYYRWVVYTAEDAVRAHQETHDMTMYNEPDALIYAKVELNMQAVKANRYLESFTRLSLLPHVFPRDEERRILAFARGPELAAAALAAGAAAAGGAELVKKIQEGELKLAEFDVVVAHPNILTDLVPIRGLMKRRFPAPRAGTLGPDLPAMVARFAGGVQYKAARDEAQPDYAAVDVPVGRCNMPAAAVAENIAALLRDIQSGRPKRDGLFITRCLIRSPPSSEVFKIDPFVYVDRTASGDAAEDSDSDDERAVG